MLRSLFVAALLALQDPSSPALELAKTIELPAVAGRMDHLAFHAGAERLYVTALGNDTVEVVDTARRERVASLRGHAEPQGAALLGKHGWIAISDGGGPGCRIYDAAKGELVREVKLGEDCDNVRYDEAADLVWVGYGGGGLVAFSSGDGAVKQRIELGGHPESFQLESDGPRAFVNVPARREVIVVDRAKGVVEARWKLDDAASNFPMALDEAHARLYVGCRSPASLLVFDVQDGRRVATVEMSGDVDDLFVDAQRSRIYAVCGEGFVDVFNLQAADKIERVARVSTRSGARTGLWIAERSTLYVAAPKRDAHDAALLELRARP